MFLCRVQNVIVKTKFIFSQKVTWAEESVSVKALSALSRDKATVAD